jgi:hypothetical protein
MKNSNKLIILAVFCLIPILFAMIPSGNAVLGSIPADHHIEDHDTGYNRILVEWSVTSGPAIDIFIFTALQYAAWVPTANIDPVAYVYKNTDSMGGGKTQDLDESETYYVVWSNENGGSPADGDYSVTWTYNPIPAFGLLGIFFGILFIGLCFYLGRRLTTPRI